MKICLSHPDIETILEFTGGTFEEDDLGAGGSITFEAGRLTYRLLLSGSLAALFIAEEGRGDFLQYEFPVEGVALEPGGPSKTVSGAIVVPSLSFIGGPDANPVLTIYRSGEHVRIEPIWGHSARKE